MFLFEKNNNNNNKKTKVYRNPSVIQIFPCFPPIRSSQRSSNRLTMRLWCSRERPRSTTTPTETCSSAQWTTSRWVPSSDPAAFGSRPPHLSHLDAAAAGEAAYDPRCWPQHTCTKTNNNDNISLVVLKDVTYYSTFESLACFYAIFGHLCVFLVRVSSLGASRSPRSPGRGGPLLPRCLRTQRRRRRVCLPKRYRHYSAVPCVQSFLHIVSDGAFGCFLTYRKINQGHFVEKGRQHINKLKVLDEFKGRTSVFFWFRLSVGPQALIQLSGSCFTVHQDVQHRLAHDQLQIRGLLRRFPPVAEVKKMSEAIFRPTGIISPVCPCRSRCLYEIQTRDLAPPHVGLE